MQEIAFDDPLISALSSQRCVPPSTPEAETGCHISETGRYVRAVIEDRRGRDILACYREVALMCIRDGVRRALIVSLDGDPMDHQAMHDALRALAVVGLPANFKLAMASGSDALYEVYRSAEADASLSGINARAFHDVRDATRWLEEE